MNTSKGNYLDNYKGHWNCIFLFISPSDLENNSIKHNRILLSHIKECTWVSGFEVDECRAYYIEWSKSEREK